MLSRARSSATLFAIGTSLMSINLGGQSPSKTPSAPADKYQWLEEVRGDRPLAWVKAQNERSAKVLEGDPRFAGFEAAALKVAESPDRLAIPQINGAEVYNNWQDSSHVRGILRRTSLNDYLTAAPHWQTILDYDALAAKDNEKWVSHGLTCLYPGNELCLVELSAGGEDASTMREFNLKTGQFVESGFVLPTSKQGAAWVDKDTLLVARDWGGGTMTKSGYPFVIRLWKRGQPLNESREVYRGTANDMRVHPVVLNDAGGHHAALVTSDVSIFEREVYLLTHEGVKRIGLPAKVDLEGMLDGQIIVSLNEDWQPEGGVMKFAQGSILSIDLEDVTKDQAALEVKAAIEFVDAVLEADPKAP